jgi:hypothetical protein
MQRKVVLSLAILFCLAAGAQAALTITVGAHNLLPNQAGQTVDINIGNAVGGELIQGVNFRAQLGDGGIPGFGGSDVLPLMTGVIDGAGMIFSVNANPPADNSLPPGYVDIGTTVLAGNNVLVAGDNLLATLTFDTTGFVGGSWILTLNTAGGDTNTGGGEQLILEDGSITIVPEPSSVVLGLFAIAGFGAVAIRRRRARRA